MLGVRGEGELPRRHRAPVPGERVVGGQREVALRAHGELVDEEVPPVAALVVDHDGGLDVGEQVVGDAFGHDPETVAAVDLGEQPQRVRPARVVLGDPQHGVTDAVDGGVDDRDAAVDQHLDVGDAAEVAGAGGEDTAVAVAGAPGVRGVEERRGPHQGELTGARVERRLRGPRHARLRRGDLQQPGRGPREQVGRAPHDDGARAVAGPGVPAGRVGGAVAAVDAQVGGEDEELPVPAHDERVAHPAGAEAWFQHGPAAVEPSPGERVVTLAQGEEHLLAVPVGVLDVVDEQVAEVAAHPRTVPGPGQRRAAAPALGRDSGRGRVSACRR